MGNEVNKRKDQIKEDMLQSEIKAHSIKGHKKRAEMTGQDVYDIIKDLSDNVIYFAVYDGHGTKGLQAAEGLKSEIRKKLYSDKKLIANFKDIKKVEPYFKSLYRGIQKKLAGTNEYDLSGTCSISVLLVDNKMFVINVGDSRCVLGQRKGGDEKKGEKVGIEMSIDQKPVREDEKKRIIEKGGEVSDKMTGAPRVYRKNDEVPGLAVSRSIGDVVAHQVGVSCEPEIFEKQLDSDDHFIVIASDGVWDAMSSCEVVGFIFEKMETNKEQCAMLLAEECRNRWELLNLYKQKYIMEMNINQDQNKNKSNKNNIIDIDDITCVIDFLNIEKEDY